VETGDFFLLLIWFSIGLLTFEVPALKGWATTISGIISAVSIIAVIFKPDELIQLIANYPVSYIGGAITNFVYLIGANLVRGDRFHTEISWGRILFYIVGILVLLFVLNTFFPAVPSE
jgi:hypothetical protein